MMASECDFLNKLFPCLDLNPNVCHFSQIPWSLLAIHSAQLKNYFTLVGQAISPMRHSFEDILTAI